MDLNTTVLSGESAKVTPEVVPPATAESVAIAAVSAGVETKTSEASTESKPEKAKKPGRKATKKADVVPAAPAYNFVKVIDYLKKYAAKIENAKMVNLTFPSVPSDKYTLFLSNDTSDANLVLFGDDDKMFIIDVEPTKIQVQNSGVIVASAASKVLIGKTNVVQFDVTNGVVSKMYRIGKASKGWPKVTVTEGGLSKESKTVDMVLLAIKAISPVLYETVKDCKTYEEIRSGVNTFMNAVVDVNHLIKLNEEILLAYEV